MEGMGPRLNEDAELLFTSDDAELNSNDDISSDEDPQTRTSASDTKGHDFGIECSNCRGKVIGFRYTCVQCVDVELCCACEARQAHAQHYVLRIPGPRPQDEVDEMLSRVRETVTKVLELKDAVPETPELDEPEIRIKTEKEETDDPLGVKLKEESDCTSEANARPHATSILEQAMLEITDIKEEYFEVSDTFVGDGNIKVECEAPGASTASRAGDPRVTTNIGNKPDDSCVPPVAKRRRPAPSTAPATAPPPAPLQVLHTSTQATTSSQPAGSGGEGGGGGGGGGGGEEVFKVYSHVPVPSKTSKGVQKKS
ncbi:hypothetical protein O0L34_g16755 [Tuta absoluta]|nr:hypothetical protein O0L34_g16755 [Tuta absoluta]